MIPYGIQVPVAVRRVRELLYTLLGFLSVNSNAFVMVGNADERRRATVVATGYKFGRCLASQMDHSMVYDCEYLGCVDRPVITPITERVFLSLTSAISSFHCAALTGSAGVGKCQTITDLATVGILLFLCCFLFSILKTKFEIVSILGVEITEDCDFLCCALYKYSYLLIYLLSYLKTDAGEF